MKQTDRNPKPAGRLAARLAAAATALFLLGLLATASASAAWEQMPAPGGTFAGSATPVGEEEFAEEVQLGHVGGMAVNVNGAGGVPAGTVYAATYQPQGAGTWVAMFEPEPGGELKFVEGWMATGFEEPYEVCGPAGELPNGDVVHPSCPARKNGGGGFVDVEVDQASGDVYVFGAFHRPEGGEKEIVVFSADGGEVITRFGEQAADGTTTTETPAKIHASSPELGSLAVDGNGTVYVADQTSLGEFHHRLMVFEPETPSNHEHYVYAGEVAAGGEKSSIPTGPVSDAAGNVYVVGEEGASIEEYAPEAPAAFPGPPSSPVCGFDYAKGGITAMTVNPENGEVFFFAFKKPKLVHRLGPCDEETGEFSETEAFKVAPERADLAAMAFDPARQIEASRAPGVLYGAAPAGKPGGSGESSLGYIFAHVKEVAPVVEAQSVSHVGTTTASLTAQINPKGSATRYVFQYLSEAEYLANEPGERFAGAAEAPPGDAALGSGQEAIGAAAALSGLMPDTAYRYRVIATSNCSGEDPAKVCEGSGAAEAFRTFPLEAPGLADQRAWELVSPAQKHGGQALPADPYISSCGIAECKPNQLYTRFPKQSRPDGNAVVYEGTPFFPGQGTLIENQYIAHRDPQAGWQTTTLSPSLQAGNGDGAYEAFDTELSEGLLFQASPSLSPEAPSEYANFYRQPIADPLSLGPLLGEAPPNRSASGLGAFAITYAGASEDFSHIFFAANDALSGETPFAPGALDGGANKNNLYEWAGGQLRLVNVLPGNAEATPGASFGNPGAHTISADGSRAFWSDEAGQVYVREGAESTKAIADPGKFLSASADGFKVLLSDGCLYDLQEEACEDLTLDRSEVHRGGFQGIAGQSEDLSHVYFVDTAVLSGEEENGEGAKAQEGKFNLYAWSEGTSRFVAALVARDKGAFPFASAWSPEPAERAAEASPTGHFLTFVSQAALTGYDNIGPCEEISGTGKFLQTPCPEAFLYDSDTGELTCASCNPTGVRPLGYTVLRTRVEPQPRYLSDEGRLFFDSEDSLSPFDTNEGVEDVYEYEPGGVGSCEREAGCINLISAGHEAVDSNFLAADPSGRNVFFTTRDQLTQKDRDDLIDLYDARVEGGIPGETEVARSECQGEACQPAVVPPAHPTPASSALAGDGNVEEPKASKKHHRKKRHAKKHSHGRAAKHNRGGVK